MLALGNQKVEASSDWASVLNAKNPESWWFGYLGYDLSRADVKSNKEDFRPVFQNFADVLLFEAEVVLEITEDGKVLQHAGPQDLMTRIHSQDSYTEKLPQTGLTFSSWKSREEYLKDIRIVQDQIREGNVYELNLCQYFTADQAPDGASIFLQLNQKFPMPFGAWLKGDDFEIASNSPERYLRRKENQLFSQPIKGTARRGKSEEEDAKIREQLFHSEKERAENMMIVDLVRNDLARVSKTGSTKVDEMFGIYPFPTVFQMISSIRSELKDGLNSSDAIWSTFPMGSMTGAPKGEVMDWIQRLEPFRRGAYSGALGYFGPGNEFDFNVLIRSLFINHKDRTCGFAVGSAITIDSVPEDEWEECKVKARTILQTCGSSWEEIRPA
jgi:para-aminobenzoate synthetase component 1